jgi:hypothetical protein
MAAFFVSKVHAVSPTVKREEAMFETLTVRVRSVRPVLVGGGPMDFLYSWRSGSRSSDFI